MLKIEHGVIFHSSLGSILDNLISSFEDYVDKFKDENVSWFIPNIESAKIDSIQEYKRKEAVTMYFIQNAKPKIIARKLKIPVEIIYRDIDQVKKQVLKAIDFDTDKTQSKHKDSNDMTESVKSIVENLKSDWITISKIGSKLNAVVSYIHKISNYKITKTLKRHTPNKKFAATAFWMLKFFLNRNLSEILGNPFSPIEFFHMEIRFPYFDFRKFLIKFWNFISYRKLKVCRQIFYWEYEVFI